MGVSQLQHQEFASLCPTSRRGVRARAPQPGIQGAPPGRRCSAPCLASAGAAHARQIQGPSRSAVPSLMGSNHRLVPPRPPQCWLCTPTGVSWAQLTDQAAALGLQVPRAGLMPGAAWSATGTKVPMGMQAGRSAGPQQLHTMGWALPLGCSSKPLFLVWGPAWLPSPSHSPAGMGGQVLTPKLWSTPEHWPWMGSLGLVPGGPPAPGPHSRSLTGAVRGGADEGGQHAHCGLGVCPAAQPPVHGLQHAVLDPMELLQGQAQGLQGALHLGGEAGLVREHPSRARWQQGSEWGAASGGLPLW